MRTWIIGHDFSPPSSAALAVAAGLLSEHGGGRLVVCHIHEHQVEGFGTELTTPWHAGIDVTGTYMAQELDELVKELATIHAAGVVLVPSVVDGPTPEALFTEADKEAAELIVVGSHGRRGFRRLLLGSVAERVVREARRSVLVVKLPHGAEDGST